MARTRRVTQEKVFEVADALRQEGVPPSIILVRKEIGYGSYGTIGKYLTVWEEARTPSADEPEAPPLPDSLRKSVEQFGETIWRSAIQAAGSSLDQERATLQAARDSLDKEGEIIVEQANDALDKADQLEAKLEESKSANSELSSRIHELESQLAVQAKELELSDRLSQERVRESEQLAQKHDAALREVANAKSQIVETVQENKHLAFRIEELIKRSDEKTAEIDQLRVSLKDRESDVLVSKGESEHLQSKIKELQLKLDQAERERDQMRSGMAQLEGQLKEKTEHVARSERRMDELWDKLDIQPAATKSSENKEPASKGPRKRS